MAISFYTPQQCNRVSFPLHPLQHIQTIYVCRFFDDGHSDWCEVIPHCCFDLHFSNNERQDWKRSLFILIPKKCNDNECSNYHTIALISHSNKVMLKILQARLQQYVNCELPDVQAGFRKGRGSRDQIADVRWIIKKSKSSREASTSALLIMPKPLTV